MGIDATERGLEKFGLRIDLQDNLSDELARQSDLCYIVVNCGVEGIEDILWVGMNKEKAREVVLKAREVYGDGICVEYPRERSFPDPDNLGSEKKVFEIYCACEELGVPAKKHLVY